MQRVVSAASFSAPQPRSSCWPHRYSPPALRYARSSTRGVTVTPIYTATTPRRCTRRSTSPRQPSTPTWLSELARSSAPSWPRENLPGLSLAVGIAGEVVWAEGFGWADIDERRPVTPKTLFRVGSVAKPMTATAVGVLHERGLLDLDAPVRDYVPSFPKKEWTVTTRQLMGHVAGVRHFQDDEEILYMRDHCESPLDGLALFADDPLLFPPGTRYEYSSYGWTLVGAVVEAAAGEPFLDVMQREVYDPSNMRDTVPDVVLQPTAQRTRFYWPFAARNPSYGIEDANDADNSCIQGAGALLSTPSDVVRFGLAMLGGRLLRSETLDMLRMPLELESGESTGYGLGWFVGSAPLGPEANPTIFGHGGSSVGGFTSLMTLPEHGIVVAVTTNVSFAENLPLLSLRLAGIFAGVEAATSQDLLDASVPVSRFAPRAW